MVLRDENVSFMTGVLVKSLHHVAGSSEVHSHNNNLMVSH